MPIPGTPPSLINPPSGATSIPAALTPSQTTRASTPQLEPVPDEPQHHVACLLESEVRRSLWAQLREGNTPQEALASVGSGEPTT